MGDIPVEARRVVAELRSTRRRAALAAPEIWTPSESFEASVTSLNRVPVRLDEHLEWMHHHWNLSRLLAPPPGRGLKGFVRRQVHRFVLFAFTPYFEGLQEYLAETLRALDAVAKRCDEDAGEQLRVLGAIRSDLIDFAHHVEERLGD